jgi:hypothetical protein
MKVNLINWLFVFASLVVAATSALDEDQGPVS